MRLFVSVDLPADLAEPIRSIQSELREASGLRMIDPDQAHVTLKFLGSVEGDRLATLDDALSDAVDRASVGPFHATLEGIGVFPSLEYINVVWVGIGDGAEEMRRLHESIEEETTAIGFDPEEHTFTPHVTIARMDHAGGKGLVQAYVEGADPDLGTFPVGAVCLTESTLTESGPSYSTVERYPLEA